MQLIKPNFHSASAAASNVIALPLTAAQAKEQVLSHWDYLDRLCQRRFPGQSNLAHEGLLFVMEQFEKDDWYRIRTWQGKGKFSTYLTTLGSRLLTDFQRKKQGHIRLPQWLKEKSDPIWPDAYRLLIMESLTRQEALSKLAVSYPNKESWFIEQVVTAVKSRCDSRAPMFGNEVDIDDQPEPTCDQFIPDQSLEIQDEELTAVLWELLQTYPEGRGPEASPCLARVRSIGDRLKPHLTFTEEDKMLLRMRYVDGLNMKKIARLLNLSGDPYKRLQRILKGLRLAFEQAEITSC